MQFGAVLPHHDIGTDPGAIRDYAQGLQSLGVTHLLVYDHVIGADRDRPGGFTGPYDKDDAFHEPFALLGFIAAVTTTLELTTAVLILPQRQTVLVAKQAAEVAILSGGRLRLGVGIGWNRVEYDALGVPFNSRGRREEEQVEVLRRLWSEDVVSFAGRFHTIERAGINPRPEKPIPVWFGGRVPALLERCARIGDGWVVFDQPDGPTRARLDDIRRHREGAGRSMEGFAVQSQARHAGGDPDQWRDHADRWRELGATHLAVATHHTGPADADGHLSRVSEYLDAVR
jgi:probable F420-dependent oxidoreductase